MSDDNIINLSEKVNSSKFLSPMKMLEEAIQYLKDNPEEEKRLKKAVLILIDTSENQFRVDYFFANLRYSEVLVAANIAQIEALSSMGY